MSSPLSSPLSELSSTGIEKPHDTFSTDTIPGVPGKLSESFISFLSLSQENLFSGNTILVCLDYLDSASSSRNMLRMVLY